MSEEKGDIRDDNEVTCPMNGCLFQLLETLFFLLFTLLFGLRVKSDISLSHDRERERNDRWRSTRRKNHSSRTMFITRWLRRIGRYLSLIYHFLLHLLFSCRRERILRREASRWNSQIFVCQVGSKRRMRFQSLFSGSQSEVDLNDLHHPSDEYIQLLIFASLLSPATSDDRHFLCFGLGGGVLPRALRRLDPSSWIDIVELDSVVVQLAREEFFFVEDERMRVILSDAQRFVPTRRYSSIFIDVYDGWNEMPVQMQSEDFLRALSDRSDLLIFNLVYFNPTLKDFLQAIEKIFPSTTCRYFLTKDSFNLILLVGPSMESTRKDFGGDVLRVDLNELARREIRFSSEFL